MKDRLEAAANGFVNVPPLLAIGSVGLFTGVLLGSNSLGLGTDLSVVVAIGVWLAFLGAVWMFQTELD